MRLRQCILIAVPLLGIAACTGDRNATVVTDLLNRAKGKLAPDRRTVVFDVTGELRGTTLTLKGEIHSAELRDQLLRTVKEEGYEPVDSLTVLPHRDLGDRTVGIVSQSVANMRARPGHPSEMVTQAIMGTPVRILKKDDGWLYVQTPDDYLGWSDAEITAMTAEEYEVWVSRPKVVVTTEVGFVRSSRDPASRPVSDLVAGSLFALKGDAGAYYDVEYPDGRTGFLLKEHAAPYAAWLNAAEDTPERIVATAYRFFGVPYLWGGTSAKGMDCSGFTKTVYFLNGVLLPRDASQQALVGEPVSQDDNLAAVRPGDLLFFGSRAKDDRPERITHVAISLGGRRFIHTGGGAGVSTNSLDPADTDYSKHRERGFLHVRRIIGAGEEAGIRRLAAVPYYKSHER
jgi:hypothetical protein